MNFQIRNLKFLRDKIGTADIFKKLYNSSMDSKKGPLTRKIEVRR